MGSIWVQAVPAWAREAGWDDRAGCWVLQAAGEAPLGGMAGATRRQSAILRCQTKRLARFSWVPRCECKGQFIRDSARQQVCDLDRIRGRVHGGPSCGRCCTPRELVGFRSPFCQPRDRWPDLRIMKPGRPEVEPLPRVVPRVGWFQACRYMARSLGTVSWPSTADSTRSPRNSARRAAAAG